MKANWICSLKQPGHITEALLHFNQAKDLLGKGLTTKTEVCRTLCDGLNKIQAQWLLQCNDPDMKAKEVKAFQTMITETLQQESRMAFLQSNELRSFVFFSPHIMNHYTLRQHQYKPDVEIEPRLAKKASEEHKKLEHAYNEYLMQYSDEIKERVLRRVAELLYIIRSNIAHGEKTPYGPDVQKIERDEQVCAVVVPVQFLLFDFLLDSPDQKLVVYGTLAPGKANHRMITDLAGQWEKCVIRGSFHETNGLPMFKWNPSGPEQEAQLVRKIYKLYLEVNSILTTTIMLNEQGYTTKKHVAKTGKTFGGVKFNKNNVHRIIMNVLYIGKVLYNDKRYDGEHEAIIDEELFEKVRERIKYNGNNRKIRKNAKCAGLLSQLLRCEACDCPMIHTYSVKDKVKKYRYYVCLKAQTLGYATCPTRSVNAQEMEDTVITHIPKIEIKDNALLDDKYRRIVPKVLSIWNALIANEKHRILKLLFASIDYNAEAGSLGMNLNEKGIYELYAELFPENNR